MKSSLIKKQVLSFAVLIVFASGFVNAQDAKVLNQYPSSVKKFVEAGDEQLKSVTPTHRQYYIANYYYTKAYDKEPENVAVNYRYAFTNLRIKDPILYVQSLNTLLDIANKYPNIDPLINTYIADAYKEKWVLSADNKKNYAERSMALDSAIYFYGKQVALGGKTAVAAQQAIKECQYAKKELTTRKLRAEVTPVAPMNTKFDDFNPQYIVQDSSIVYSSLRSVEVNEVYGLGGSYLYNIQDSSSTLFNNYGRSIITSVHPDGGGFLTCFEGDIYEYNEAIKKRTRVERAISAVNSKNFTEINATYADDGNTIYFASNCPENFYLSGKKGDVASRAKDFDLYKITRTLSEPKKEGKPVKETWDIPSKLPSSVNSNGNDILITQSRGRNGDTIFYLTSNGHGSMGGLDLFVSTYSNGVFGVPQNMGYPVNTSADESAFIVNDSNTVMYLTSDRLGGAGGRDIYSVALTKYVDDYPIACYDDILTQASDSPFDVEQALPAAIVVVKTIDESGNVISEAKVLANSTSVATNELLASATYVTGPTGETIVILPENVNAELIANKNGYYQAEDRFKTDFGYKELYKTLVLRKLVAGRIFVLKNVFFDYDKSSLRSSSLAELEKVLKLLEEYPGMEVEMLGHTDIKGSDAYNKTLSTNRAKAVCDWLKKQGVNQTRLSYNGYSFHKPIATNDTDQGRQLNRRTEIKIKKIR